MSGPAYTLAQFQTRARSLVGLPYVLGAEWSPSITAPAKPAAVDCSELVEGLYRENRTPIPDLAANQYDATTPVTGTPRVGDLVFLRNNSDMWNGIGHVAMITAAKANGDYEIIEAKGRAYGVVLTTLSFWKTRNYYAGLRRFPAFALAVSAVTLSATFRTLNRGDTGEDVAALQRWLSRRYQWADADLASAGGADGQFGRVTEQVVTAWQQRMNRAYATRPGWVPLAIDGQFGPKSAAAAETLEGWQQ